MQAPLAPRVLLRDPPNGETLPGEDRLDGLFDLWTFGEHVVALSGAHVVQVNVHGEPGNIEDEEVQGRAAL